MKNISPQLWLVIITSLVIFYACDKEVSTTPPDEEPGTGKLVITTTPPGYDIYMNNRISGSRTPDTLTYLDASSYEIGLNHHLFLDSSFTTELADGEVKTVNINFEEIPEFYAEIECESNPSNAEILLDDNPTGVYTPGLLTEVYPGQHTLSLRKFGYRSKEINLNLRSSLKQNTYMNLEDTTEWLVYTKENSQLHSNSLNCVSVSAHSVWIGTYDYGVIDLSGEEWKNYNTANSILPANRITGIGVGEDNKVMIGTEAGIVIYNNGNWELVTTQTNSNITSHNITSMMYKPTTGDGQVKNERFFFTTNGGGVIMNQFDHWSVPGYISGDVLPSLNTTCMHYLTQYSSDSYVVGTSDAGLFLFNNWGEAEQSIHNKDNAGFYSNNVTAVGLVSGTIEIYAGVKVSSGMGSAYGMLYFRNDDNVWQQVNLDLSVINDIVVDFTTTWIATNNGLYKLTSRTEVEKHFTEDNSPLETNNIYDIELDLSGNLWLATGKGLVRYNPSISSR